MRNAWITVAVMVLSLASASARSPYAGQESREIKSLSAQEIGEFLSGKGMGLAKAAELNGYPGPMHVLELASELQLSAEQKSRTEALFRKMQARAVAAGRRLVDEERALDALFAGKSITPVALKVYMERIAGLQGEVRRIHLEAHLEQVAVLTPIQVAKYNQLRGYGAGSGAESHGHKKRH